MKSRLLKIFVLSGIRIGMSTLFFLAFHWQCLAQQVQWAKVYPLAKEDKVSCITRDSSFVYAGGYTYRNAFYFNTTPFYKAIIIKLDTLGDTLFIKDLGVSGEVMSMAVDPLGMIRANVKQYYYGLNGYNTFLFTVHPSGFITRIDTVDGYSPTACTMGKDSSMIIVGHKRRVGFPSSQTSMYFRRVTKSGTVEPWIELNPGHPNCKANRIEQLPNGHYLISGYVGSRIASYEVDSIGGNPVYHEWYQTPDLTNLNYGGVGQVGLKNWFVAGDGMNTFVSMYNKSKSKVWLKTENGILAPPQGMKDSTVVFGYSSGFYPYNYFYRFRSDSSLVWFFNMRDSLTQRGLPSVVDFFSYTYFPDQSAVFAGAYYESGATDHDPFFMRIANVGTPVTSLTKPKRGTLSNETLAPWPNPSGGTLYLKQHFDKAEVHFYTVSGREVQTDTVRFGQPIDISSFAPGLYLYRAVIDGKPFSGKVVRN